MNIFKYIKRNGLQHSIKIIYKYKLKEIQQKITDKVTCKQPLQKSIVIESHNDFDENGGAFYNYLIKHGYNKDYKIVWLLKHQIPNNLPENVIAFPLYGPSWKKALNISRAKYILTDQDCIGSNRKDQVSIYLTHGGFGLKKWRGKMHLPYNLSYALMSSKALAPIERYNDGIENYPVKSLILGFPEHDIFYEKTDDELLKVTKHQYSKVILWMPTFRKSIDGRNDGTFRENIGVPVITDLNEFNKLNSYLKQKDVLLIIKIHPMQDISTLKIKSLSNIKVLTGEDVKKLNINNYKLMKDTDALISDYSSAAYDYMHLNRPIGFTMDDVKTYKLGLIVDDPKKFIGGPIINNFDDMKDFIYDVLNGKDTYKTKRNNIFNIVFEYHDGNSCERLARFLKLERDK